MTTSLMEPCLAQTQTGHVHVWVHTHTHTVLALTSFLHHLPQGFLYPEGSDLMEAHWVDWSISLSSYYPAVGVCIYSHILQKTDSLMWAEPKLIYEESILSLGIILWLHSFSRKVIFGIKTELFSVKVEFSLCGRSSGLFLIIRTVQHMWINS